jgi:hypothetical protein
LALDEAARALGIPAKVLRAIEWGRHDLLGDAANVDRIERGYAAFLGMPPERPTSPVIESPPSGRNAGRFVRRALAVLARLPPLLVAVLLAPLIVISLVALLPPVVAGAGDVEGDGVVLGIWLGLLLFSSLLFAASVLPASVVERTPVSPARYGRYRQPLALAAIGILVPLVLFGLLVVLT